MIQESKMETAKEVLEHMKFQLDLLKITSMPVELTGPSIMAQQENQLETLREMEELSSRVKKNQKS
jgi:hypothetical protein